MTQKELNQLKNLQAKYKQELKEQKQFNKKIEALNLSTKWYEICCYYDVKTNDEMDQLFAHICSQKQKEYFNRNVKFYDQI